MKKIVLSTLIILVLATCAQSGSKANTQLMTQKTTFEEKKILAATKLNETSKPTEIKLSEEQWKKLSVFFSNFSESGVKDFKKNQISNDQLILFGLRYNWHNNKKAFKDLNDTTLKISKDYIEKAVEKYLGKKKITHKTVTKGYYAYGTTDEVAATYNNGYYIIPKENRSVDQFWTLETTDYDNIALFSQISKLYNQGNGYYTADVNVYSKYISGDYDGKSPDTIPSKYWKNSWKENINLEHTLRATIKKESDGRYTLVEYKTIK